MNLNVSKDDVLNENLTLIKDSGIFKSHSYSPLSKLYTIIRAFSNSLFLFVDQHLVAIQKAIHPHTSEEPDLIEHLKRRGMSWKQATKAIFKIRIGSSTAPVTDLDIPQGLIVTTAGPVDQRIRYYLQSSGRVLAGAAPDAQGKYTVDLLAECVVEGPIGNAVQNSIVLIEDPPDGIDYVINPDADPQLQGQYKESITSVRSRIINVDKAETGSWTPSWYIAQAEAHVSVSRALFKSSKQLGIPGVVKLFVIGALGNPSPVELQAIIDDLQSEAKDPGAVARVLVENINAIPITRTVTVQFPDLASIHDQAILNEVADRYFFSLSEADDFIDTDMAALFLQLPRSIRVIFDTPGTVVINANQVAIKSATFQVIAEVYV